MRNARCWVWCAVVLFAASVAPALGPAGKEAKPLPIALGMGIADVEAKLGKPQEAASMPDGGAVWKYQGKDARVEISFERGRVTRILQAAVGDDAKEIEGTWKVVSHVQYGDLQPDPDTILLIGGGKITVIEGGEPHQTDRYRLDSNAWPRTIDITEARGDVYRGIYSLSGDDLKICIDGIRGTARPTKFESKRGSDTVLFVLKRESREWSHAGASKPGTKEPAAVEATGPKLVKVSGTVKFKDGSLIQVPADTGLAVITFVPADVGAEAKPGEVRKSTQGKIQPDGRFELYTFKQVPPDGVIPGKYVVRIVAQRNYRDPTSSLVPKKYNDRRTSGFEVTIDRPISDLQFELDKP